MFRRLLDSINTAIDMPERLIWKKHVATFQLKYPSVEISSHVFKSAPVAFLVWRRLPNQYIVDLYSSFDMLNRQIRFYSSLNERLLTSFPEQLADIVYIGEGGLLNWGRFDYNCDAGVGEFCKGKYGRAGTFVENFVLSEDRHLFSQRAN